MENETTNQTALEAVRESAEAYRRAFVDPSRPKPSNADLQQETNAILKDIADYLGIYKAPEPTEDELAAVADEQARRERENEIYSGLVSAMDPDGDVRQRVRDGKKQATLDRFAGYHTSE